MTKELEIIRRAAESAVRRGHNHGCIQAYGRDPCDCYQSEISTILAAVERLEAERQSDTERLKDVRQRVYDIGYALSCSPSEIDKRACGECVGVVELIDATVKP